MSMPGPLFAVDASGGLIIAPHRPPVRSRYREGAVLNKVLIFSASLARTRTATPSLLWIVSSLHLWQAR